MFYFVKIFLPMMLINVCILDLKNGKCIIICLYVDDMLIFGTYNDIVFKTKLFIGSKFEMKDIGEASVILGVKIIRTEDSTLLSQEKYTEKLLKKLGYYDFKSVSTPYDANSKLKKNKGEFISQTQYAQIIGSLLHLMSFSRPDIAYTVGRLSRYTQCPSQDHWDALARLMKYLRATMDYVIEYNGIPVVLEGYNDANWISDSDEENPLVVMYLHLGVMQLLGDQPSKILLQDQQWNLSLLLSKWLVVKLSG